MNLAVSNIVKNPTVETAALFFWRRYPVVTAITAGVALATWAWKRRSVAGSAPAAPTPA